VLIINGRGCGQFDHIYPPTTNRKRDSQRSRVYRAEHAVEKATPKLIKCSPTLYTDGAIKSFLSSLSDNMTLKYLFGRVEVGLCVIHSDTRCSMVDQHGIQLCVRKNGISMYEILHELAHAINQSQPHHGARFVTVFLVLVKEAIGDECHRSLLKKLNRHGVKYKKLNEKEIQHGILKRIQRRAKATGTRGQKSAKGKTCRKLFDLRVFFTRRSR